MAQMAESRKRIIITKLRLALRRLSPAPGSKVVYAPDLEDAKGFIEQALEEIEDHGK